MKDFVSHVMRSFVLALSAAALGALTIALMLALYDIPRTADIAVLLWGGTLLAQAIVCELLTRRSVSMLAYVLASAVILFFGGEQAISHTVFIPGSSGFPVFLRICIWTSGAVCAYGCQKEPGSNVYVRLSDVLILSIGGYMATLYALKEAMILPALAFAGVALLLCMLVSASLRAGGESDSVIRGTGMGGYLVIGALLMICLLLAALLLSAASGHVGGIVEAFLALWHLITVLLRDGFTFIVLFLNRLFGGPRMIARPPAAQQDSLAYSGGPMEEMGTAPQWVVYLVMGVIAAFVLAAILAILWALRRARIGRTHRKKTQRKVTRTSHAAKALRALISRVIGLITFELRYRTSRRTPQGLYVLAVRTGRVKRIPRKKHESPGAYIRRLHHILLAQTGLSTLDRLADMLDRALYGDGRPHLSHGEADAFAAQIRAIAAPPIIKTAKDG